jgi:hypothetical protein
MGAYAGPIDSWIDLSFSNSLNGLVTNGLVLALDAARTLSYPGSGTTWTDLSGNGNNGTLTNGPTFSSANLGSLSFDGTNDFINCGNILNFTTESFTFNIFFYLTSTTTNSGQGPVLFYKGDYQSNGYYCQVDTATSSTNMAFVTNQSGANQTTSSTSALVVGGWNCVTVVRSGSSVTNYINGLNATSGAGTHINPTSSSQNFTLSRYGSSAFIYSNIRIASFQAYNRALTETEVQQNFNALNGRYGEIITTTALTPGLAGKFFNGSWRATIATGNIGTLPLTTTNDSSNVTGTTGLPSADHRYGVNLWPSIAYGNSIGDNYGFIAIGYFTPPTTGSYTFYTSSDDYSGVWEIGRAHV